VCTGSCTATANTTCQEQCQESSYDQCRTQLANNCTTQCQGETGAIFCNGEYVNASDLQQCIDALNAILSVQISATGSASCDGGECNAEGAVTTKTTCAASPMDRRSGALWAFGAVGLAAIVAKRRRARR
jgi:MYXO-CTERM domain-containing protein